MFTSTIRIQVFSTDQKWSRVRNSAHERIFIGLGTDSRVHWLTLYLLFERGFIGFEDSENLIISPVAHKPSLERMGLETKGITNVGNFSSGQRQFLEFHRNAILLRVAR